MQFTANRLLLLKAVKTALKVVRPNRDIPEIAGVLIEADASSGLLTVTGTDVRTHIQRRLRQEQVEESGSIILTPLIASVLDKLAGESVSFQSDKGTVLIRSGNASFSLPFLEAITAPRVRAACRSLLGEKVCYAGHGRHADGNGRKPRRDR